MTTVLDAPVADPSAETAAAIPPLRLMHVIRGAAVGGAEVFFERLAGAFAGVPGMTQHVVMKRFPAREAKVRALGVEPEFTLFGRWGDVFSRRAIRTAAQRFEAEIVLSWMSRASWHTPRGPWTHVARLGGYYDLKYYRSVDHFVGNTPDICDFIRRNGARDDQVWYLPNFVEESRHAPESRGKHDTPDDAPLILGLGRLHPCKGFDVLINAVAEIPNAHLWIAGEGKQRAELEALITHLGMQQRVRLLGWRDDPIALMEAADVFVCASRDEPLGNIVLEAWAHKTPVVAADAQGPRQLLKASRNGLMVRREQAGEMATAIRRILDEPTLAQDLIAQGYQSYRSQFSRRAVVARYLEFFAKVHR